MIQVDLKESYYRYSKLIIKYLGVVSWLLLFSLLISLAQLSYKYNLIDKLPPAFKETIQDAIKNMRSLDQVN